MFVERGKSLMASMYFGSGFTGDDVIWKPAKSASLLQNWTMPAREVVSRKLMVRHQCSSRLLPGSQKMVSLMHLSLRGKSSRTASNRRLQPFPAPVKPWGLRQ